MSKNEFQESQLSRVMDAIKRGDGLAASAIFQKVETCAWSNLLRNASEQLSKDQYVVGFEHTSTMPTSTPYKDTFIYSQQ